MSSYWATAMILDSIERDRRRMAEAERRGRPPRYDDAGFLGGSEPAGAPRRRQPGSGRGPRNFSFRGGPVSVLISIG